MIPDSDGFSHLLSSIISEEEDATRHSFKTHDYHFVKVAEELGLESVY